MFVKTFKISPLEKTNDGFDILNSYDDIVDVSDNFKYDFKTAGILINGVIYTEKIEPVEEGPITLGQIAQGNVDNHFYLTDTEAKKFEYLRGSKKIQRKLADGHEYTYFEGAMSP